MAEHPIIGTVVLIVSELYNERIKYKRIVLMSNDIEMQAPAAILMYKRRWRIEVWFKAVKQEINLAMFQLQQLELIGSHFQLRGICYTQRQLKLRFFSATAPGMPYPHTWLKAQFLAMRSITHCSGQK